LCGGCAGTQYGSHLTPVVLDTNPPGGEIYVVPNQVWLSKQDKLMSGDADALKPFFRGPGPQTAHLPPYQWIFVAQDAQKHRAFREFNPRDDDKVVIELGPTLTPKPER
jgi:hypothetical protein